MSADCSTIRQLCRPRSTLGRSDPARRVPHNRTPRMPPPRDPPDVTGLAHVATVSFLASRATPSGAFALALAGGVALARAAATHGLRSGYGASAAAILQTVALMGPARVNGPMTQAMSAPPPGRVHAREAGARAEVPAGPAALAAP